MQSSTKELNTHIKTAIDIWEKVFTYDYGIYANTVHDAFRSFHVESKNQIDTFWKVFELTSERDEFDFYYRQDDESYDIKIKSGGSYKKYTIPSAIETMKSFDIPDNAKNVIERVYRTLICCKQLYPNDINETNENWITDFENSLNISDADGTEKSRWVSKDLIVQTSLFLCRQSIEQTTAQDIYYNIVKSLLNAEYLILDNYSTLLKDVIELRVDKKGANVIMPWYERSIVALSMYLNEMCLRIKKTINDPDAKRVVVDYHADEYATHLFSACYLVGVEVFEKFDFFVRSVIKMTLIDHFYVLDSNNFEDLLLLWQRSIIIEDDAIVIEDNRNIHQQVRDKVAKMICVFDEKSQKESKSYYFSLGSKHGYELLSSIQMNMRLFSSDTNPYLLIKKQHRNKEIKQSEIDGKIIKYSYGSSQDDLTLYDDWAKKGQSSYLLVSSVLQKISDFQNNPHNYEDDEIKNITSQIDNFLDNNSDNSVTSVFYIKAISLLDEIIEVKYGKDAEDRYVSEHDVGTILCDKLIGLMSRLLIRFKSYINKIETCIAPSYIPTFAYSFYIMKDGRYEYYKNPPLSVVSYDIKHFKDAMFFASLEMSVQNPQYCYSFIEEYTSKWNRMVMSRTAGIRNYVNSAMKIQRENDKEVVSQMRNENLHTRNHTVQLLGLFAAFIALITSAVGSMRIARSVPEFIVFLLALSLCVVIFATLISFLGRRSLVYATTQTKESQNSETASIISEAEKKEGKSGEKEGFGFKKWMKKEEHWDWLVPASLALVLLMMLVLMLWVYKIPVNSSDQAVIPGTSIFLSAA